jgi:hypothetical protein
MWNENACDTLENPYLRRLLTRLLILGEPIWPG